MRSFLLLPTVGLALLPACRPAPAAPLRFPPTAASAPLALPDPDEDDFEAPPPSPPRGECEAPPKTGVAEPDFGPVRAFIDETLRWTAAPSLAVAVARDGTILWEEGFGFADPRRRTKATENTMYSLASISKPLTATGIMLLRERGQLQLEQPVDEVLPPPGLWAGVGDPQQATVLRVASHTAGLPLHYQFYYEGEGPEAPSLEQTRRRYAVTVSEPGERYQYSNLGFGLLGQAVEHVGGAPFADFMRAEVFEPLDLEHTFVGTPPRRAGTTAPRMGSRGKALPGYGFDHDGASALYSSAHDLVRFGMFHVGTPTAEQAELLPAEARALMQQPVAPAETYGIGWGIGREGAMVRVGHGGGMPGVATTLRMFPEQGVVVTVLVNASAINGAHVEIARRIEHAIGLPSRADALCTLPEDHRIFGTWKGELATVDGPRPLSLELRPDGEVLATIGEAPPSIVRLVQLEDDALRGVTFGDVAAELGGGRSTRLVLDLKLRGDTLSGGVTAFVPWKGATTLVASLERED